MENDNDDSNNNNNENERKVQSSKAPSKTIFILLIIGLCYALCLDPKIYSHVKRISNNVHDQIIDTITNNNNNNRTSELVRIENLQKQVVQLNEKLHNIRGIITNDINRIDFEQLEEARKISKTISDRQNALESHVNFLIKFAEDISKNCSMQASYHEDIANKFQNSTMHLKSQAYNLHQTFSSIENSAKESLQSLIVLANSQKNRIDYLQEVIRQEIQDAKQHECPICEKCQACDICPVTICPKIQTPICDICSTCEKCQICEICIECPELVTPIFPEVKCPSSACPDNIKTECPLCEQQTECEPQKECEPQMECPEFVTPKCPEVTCPEVITPTCPEVAIPYPALTCPEVVTPTCPEVVTPTCPEVVTPTCPEVVTPTCPTPTCPEVEPTLCPDNIKTECPICENLRSSTIDFALNREDLVSLYDLSDDSSTAIMLGMSSSGNSINRNDIISLLENLDVNSNQEVEENEISGFADLMTYDYLQGADQDEEYVERLTSEISNFIHNINSALVQSSDSKGFVHNLAQLYASSPPKCEQQTECEPQKECEPNKECEHQTECEPQKECSCSNSTTIDYKSIRPMVESQKRQFVNNVDLGTDFASVRNGAYVIKSSETYLPKDRNTNFGAIAKGILSKIGVQSDWIAKNSLVLPDPSYLLQNIGLESGLGLPHDVLTGDMTLGSCWPMNGYKGFITIKLASSISPVALAINHLSISEATDISTAPKHFEVFMNLSNNQNIHFDGYYDITKADSLQLFDFPNIDNVDATADNITIVINSNYGNNDYTCIYSISVFGRDTK